jgi:hypothetical protein
MTSAAKKPPGKGLEEKRGRILRCLEAHMRYLATVERMAPWQPTAFGHEPRPRQTPAEWAAHWERYSPPRYVWPRERPALAHPSPGPDDLPEEDVKAWVEASPFIRGGLSHKTQAALAYIESFRRP